MARINENFKKLKEGYLFPEIHRRSVHFQKENPEVELIKLGIGDTTRPLSPAVVRKMHETADEMADEHTYKGYGAEQGLQELREALTAHYKDYGVNLDPDEIFISDGAKSDLANIQSIFSGDAVVAVQDPVYPAYVDSTVISGRSGSSTDNGYEGIIYMDCTEANGFFPALPDKKADIIYLCSPNNPTGAVATHDQLKSFVDYARQNKSVIIFDAAYAGFISDPGLPRSIYEVEGAKECAVEINSFSKLAGFTGVRLGWTIVPDSLRVEGSANGEVRAMWNRRQTTMFNGASTLAQLAGLAVFSESGKKETKELIDYYMKNAGIIKEGLSALGIEASGGENAPYIWAKTPGGMDSWKFFDKLMNEAHVVVTPGVGFGKNGEGHFRLSAFGKREDIQQAMDNIRNNLKI